MKNGILSVASFVISLAVGAYCVYACYIARGIPAFIPMYAVLTVLCFPLSCILHEAGHMLFGLMVKIKVVSVRIRILRPSEVKIVPKTDKNLRGRLIFTALGGLALNLIFIALGVVALSVPAVPAELSLALPASAYLFMLNAVPLYFASGKTDGLFASELIKNDDNAKVTVAVLTVQAQVLNGKPIEEVDENLLFGLPQIQEDDESFIALTELRYEYFKAKGDDVQAEKYRLRFEDLKKDYT